MQKKSLAWQILSFTAVIIGIYGGYFGENGQQILGIVSFAITALLQSSLMSIGQWPKGWGAAVWITQIAGVIVQIANYMTNNGLLDSTIVNVFVLTINAILTIFVKDYNAGTSKG